MTASCSPRVALTLAVLLVAVHAAASAQGLIILHDHAEITVRSARPLAGPLSLREHRVEAKIQDQVAWTRIVQVWQNHTDVDQEATYFFPIPHGAAISDFAMVVPGAQPVETKLLSAEEARRIYEDIVRRKKDPALLEFVGRDVIQARIYPVPARGERRIEIAFTQAIPLDQGLGRFVADLTLTGYTSAPVQTLAVNVDIGSAHEIKSVYSPSHPIAVNRLGDKRVNASFECRGGTSDRDFELYFGLSDTAMGLHVLTSREPGEDGTFLLMLAPRFDVVESEMLPRDVVFAFDTSGSMAGEKMLQARNALTQCVKSLRPRDRFNVLSFNTAVQGFDNGLLPATPENTARALAFVGTLEARGGTNIQSALRTALRLLDTPNRSAMVVFMTDGLPTIGETDLGLIETEVKKANTAGARLYAFGIGNDVNTHFLDRLSQTHHGVSEYVREKESIDTKVTAFMTKISSPVLGNVTVSAPAALAYDLYPPDTPDLFRGAQLLLFGRYRGKGPVDVTVKGRLEGREQTYVFQVQLPDVELRNPFLPRIWAAQKIGYLLDEMRLRGRSKELVDEVLALSRKYGIMTEFTSFLIDEEGRATPEAVRTTALDNFHRAFEVTQGDWAISQCQNAEQYKRADNAAAVNVFLTQVGEQQRVDRVRAIGRKVFYRRGAQWVDVEALGISPAEVVDNYSTRYFELTRDETDFNRYQALGGEVIVKQGSRVIHCK